MRGKRARFEDEVAPALARSERRTTLEIALVRGERSLSFISF